MRVQPSRVLSHGVVAGALGYLVVAAAHTGLNIVQGRPAFATASHLGASLVGSAAAAGGGFDPGPVIAFNGIHLVAGLLAGVVASWLIQEWEAHPAAGYFVFFTLIAGLIMGSFMSAIVVSELAHAASWPAVLLINGAAAAVMAGYLLSVHPALRTQLARLGVD